MSETVPFYTRWSAVAGAAGIVVAVVWMGVSLPSTAHPLGSDWGHHFTVAEFIWHPDPKIGYPLFRRPWYGWLLGAVGEGMGYFQAAQLIGRCSAMAMVLAAGIGAWALAGPLAGAAASMACAWMPLVREGGLWVNHYPLLGAACGLALASGVAASRWPRVPWVLLAGLSGGAAAAVDVRGEAVLLAVLLLVGTGLPWARNWRRTAGLGLVLIMSAAVVPVHGVWLDKAFDIPEIEFQEQVRVQRRGVLAQIHGGTLNDRVLEQACAGLEPGPVDAAGLRSSCASALRANALGRLSADRILPATGTLALFALVLLPTGPGRRERWRSSLVAGVVFGLPVASLWVGMGWVTYFPRYVLPFAAILAMGIPVAMHRVLVAWGRGPRWLGALAAMASIGWLVQIWPGLPRPLAAAQTEGPGADRAAGYFASWVSEHMGASDFMVDCAGLAVDSLLLPRRIDYLRFPPGDPACTHHIRSPVSRPGITYLITMHRDLPEHADEDAHSRDAIAAAGWALVQTGAPTGYQLWQHQVDL